LPLHLQPCFGYLGYKKGDFPEAERASSEVLALPIYPELTEGLQVEVVDTIKRFCCK
jgi:dTDP-4-amino-4,6-dideoxygalactose transaminase